MKWMHIYVENLQTRATITLAKGWSTMLHAHLRYLPLVAPNDEEASEVEEERRKKVKARMAFASWGAKLVATSSLPKTQGQATAKRPLTFNEIKEEDI